jgi:hypothetical protein
MYLNNMFRKRNGISTFIATLLLMVLAVSAGVVIYAYTMGYMGGFGGTDTLGAMSLDEASMDGTSGIDAYIRNIGKTDLKIVTAYVDGNLVDDALAIEITEGLVEAINLPALDITTAGVTITTGHTYEVKLICEDNTQLSFTVKCG